jgi:FkbH-like protein
MILKEDDIAIFVANWKDKPSNIKYIAETLSIGLESCVFFDDNPAERMHVREKLPEVAVPELPNDAEFYLSTLFAAGYFETTNFSMEDIGRADYYKKNYLRKKLLTKNSNINDYLKKLKMKILFKKFDKLGRARILQLISKSNQFNLTTNRYNEEEIKKIEKNENYFTRQIRLEDIFGDNGMISVLICKKISKVTWGIDTWLMSCRVLGRKVEEAVLYDLVNIAKKNNIKKIFGTYVPTLRNIIVKNHYKDLNFKFLKKNNGVEFWELDIKNYKKPILPMKFCY